MRLYCFGINQLLEVDDLNSLLEEDLQHKLGFFYTLQDLIDQGWIEILD